MNNRMALGIDHQPRSTSIIKENIISLPIWYSTSHNLFVADAELNADSDSLLPCGGVCVARTDAVDKFTFEHTMTYQEIEDMNNVDYSIVSPDEDEDEDTSQLTGWHQLPREIRPRQLDNLVQVTIDNVHIVLDKASGVHFTGTCYATPDVIDECLQHGGLLVPINNHQGAYVLSRCVPNQLMPNKPSLLKSDTQQRISNHNTTNTTDSCEIPKNGPTHGICPVEYIVTRKKNGGILEHVLVEQPQPYSLVQSSSQENGVHENRHYTKQPQPQQSAFSKEDMLEYKTEASVQTTALQVNDDKPRERVMSHSAEIQPQYLLKEQGLPESLVQIPKLEECTPHEAVNTLRMDTLSLQGENATSEGKSDSPSSSGKKRNSPVKRQKFARCCKRDTEDEKKEEYELKKVSSSGSQASNKKRKKKLSSLFVNSGGQRNVAGVQHQVTVINSNLEPAMHKTSHLTPCEEVQHGTHSSMVLSNTYSWMHVLETFTQVGRSPVICLLHRDLACGDIFSSERRSRPRSMISRPATNGTLSFEGRNLEGQMRDSYPSGIMIHPLLSHEITQHLHASDYSKMIQLLGNINDLPPESQMPAYFIAGVAYFKMSKFTESKEHFCKCESLAMSENRDGDVMLCNAYLGDIEYAVQSYIKATKHYSRSIRYYSSGSVALLFKLTPPTLSAIYAKQASSFRNSSKMIEAVKNYRTAIEKAQTDRDRLSAHTSLGNLYQSMGDNNNALKEYEQSIELAKKLSDHVSLGWAHGNIGNAYLGLNKKDEALHHLQKSLDLAIEYEQTPQAIGRTYNNLGTAYQSMNDLDKAEEYYDLALSQAIYGNDIPGQARVYGNIGNVYMLRKNYERAIPHYSEVLRLSSDPSTVSTARHNRGCAYYEWATSLDVSALARVSYHGPECDTDPCLSTISARAKDLFSKGICDLQEVVKHHETRFHEIKGSKNGLTLSVSLIESNSRTFHRLQDCLVNLHRWEEALVVAEQSRARTLGELMLKRKGCHVQNPLSAPLTFEQITSIVRGQKCPIIYLSYTGARLIGWIFVPHLSKVTMYAFTVPLSDDQFEGKSFDYHLRYSLTEKLVEHSFEMYQPIVYDERSSSTVQVLFDLVASPVARFLSKQASYSASQKVIFISDSYTSLLPLTCLFDKDTNSFFGDQLYFKLAPSFLSLGIMSQLPQATVTHQLDPHDFCVIGDPNIPPFYLNGELWTLGKLPYAQKEAEWVAHALQTTPILNEHASKTALLNRAMSAKVIHIATHGSSTSGFLAFSTFATAAKSGSYVCVKADNVLLYPQDVEKLNISPALVVLSSCDSGRGTVKADGIQGMARAFILAGAQSVLTTLWKVPDESASVFMQFFYQYLLDEMESSYALQKAILSIRCFAKYSQYIHWSGYQLTGRDIVFSKNQSLDNESLRRRLGQCSLFPRINEIKALEMAFTKSPSLPTDVHVSKAILLFL